LRQVICQTYNQTIGRAISGDRKVLASLSLLHTEPAKGELLSREDERSHSGKGGLFVHYRDRFTSINARRLADFLSR